MNTGNSTAHVVFQDFTAVYEKEAVIRNIKLAIPRHQIFTLFGPSRSGKTTLLRTLNRMNDFFPAFSHSGNVYLGDQEIYQPATDITDLRRRVGMVYALPSPLPMSIFDNVVYGPRVAGLSDRRRLAEIAEEALVDAALWDEVKDRLGTPAMRLSGGQQQRLCIARTLALNPEVLLLDEPTSGLDPISTARIEETLRRLKERITVIFAPSNVQQAARVADRAAFLLMGELIEEGTGVQIFTNPHNQRTEDYVTGRFG
jgi:phosphate transport system ATP-binding protein